MSGYKRRRRFDRDFKREAVRLTMEEGRTVKGVAEGLGVHPNVLHRWRREYLNDQEEAFPGKGHRTNKDEELFELRKELVRVKEERDILKKAVKYFSNHSL